MTSLRFQCCTYLVWIHILICINIITCHLKSVDFLWVLKVFSDTEGTREPRGLFEEGDEKYLDVAGRK